MESASKRMARLHESPPKTSAMACTNDLSFSQILEVRSRHLQHRTRKKKQMDLRQRNNKLLLGSLYENEEYESTAATSATAAVSANAAGVGAGAAAAALKDPPPSYSSSILARDTPSGSQCKTKADHKDRQDKQKSMQDDERVDQQQEPSEEEDEDDDEDEEMDEEDEDDESDDDEDWASAARSHGMGLDVYRFVQPRRLSSWVQDDAVNACFKCHTFFTLMIRKHHCRACGRIFCGNCSSQRVVIPPDYESTPVLQAQAAYAALTSNATDVLGNLRGLILGSGPTSSSSRAATTTNALVSNLATTPRGEILDEPGSSSREERFLLEVQRLQQQQIITKFTPGRRVRSLSSNSLTGSSGRLSSSHSATATSPLPSQHQDLCPTGKAFKASSLTPGGASPVQYEQTCRNGVALEQRVCDDCACALVQRRQHQDTVKVFELCQFNLQELRVLGQVCRKWHRASVMCLSTFRQIQYYLPSHRLSPKEKTMLLINRDFLAGHTKWLVQLVKAIDFGEAHEQDQSAETRALVHEVLQILQRPRQHKCMLTMCSRLCQREIGSIEALEILADETVCNTKLRSFCVESLSRNAGAREWLSYLPVLLQSVSVEANAMDCALGQALLRQATLDVRFCYDLYWGLTVMAEDHRCRRRFDVLRQRLLLHLARNDHRLSIERFGASPDRFENVADQLLNGQTFVDVLWKLPARVPVEQVRKALVHELKSSRLFGQDLDMASSSMGMGLGDEQDLNKALLRLPVDPLVKIGGIDVDSITIKQSAEAPMIFKCIQVERDTTDDDDEDLHVHSSTNGGVVTVASTTASTAPGSSGTGHGIHQPHPHHHHHHHHHHHRASSGPPYYRLMYKRDDLRKDAIVQNIINVMYGILKQETRLDIPLVTYRVVPTSSFDGLIEIVENAQTLRAIINQHGNIMNFLHLYNGHRTLGEICSSYRDSLAAYTVITFLLGVGDRHADNVMLTRDGLLFHIDYGFILGKDPKPLQPPMRVDDDMIEALGGSHTIQYDQFKSLCVIAFNCLRRHVSLFMILLTLVVKAMPEITDFGMNYTQSDLEAFVIERFLPGQSDEEAALALMLRMEGKFNERIGLKLSDFVHAHANENTVSKSMLSVGSTVSNVASSLSNGASSMLKYVWGGAPAHGTASNSS